MKNETVLGLSKVDKGIIIIFPPIIGALIGWFIPTISGWLIKIPFIPFDGIFQWVASLGGTLVSIIGLSLGIIAGIIFTMYAFTESLKITVSDLDVKLLIKEDTKVIDKEDISAVFISGKNLIILSADGMELYHEKCESKKEKVEEAFKHHGYPWSDKDPYDNEYFRWVEDHSDITPHINVLLSARERSLKNAETEEAEVLRKDLSRLGVIIRDEGKRQYIRMVKR